jgi:hypothetical protein
MNELDAGETVISERRDIDKNKKYMLKDQQKRNETNDDDDDDEEERIEADHRVTDIDFEFSSSATAIGGADQLLTMIECLFGRVCSCSMSITSLTFLICS